MKSEFALLTNKQLESWIASRNLFFSSKNQSFYYGGHTGQGTFDLRQLPASISTSIEIIELENTSCSAAVVDLLYAESEDGSEKFASHFVTCQGVLRARLRNTQQTIVGD
ncbi:hypothetical protein QTP81_16260 [Alteromonas sp. ASW11-36]|uniref:Nuclear transport factor 2 family protein n=1 Tax=Alteromonas arenosi TaxID=3055817 RepID=A0ABT7T149_9ALTE|nr:hypothetical protein [Alteromonas sp. ASW11-36]MDM7862160.1 hypothetical protein [Alteromonas sp. ASW11-36]